MRESGDRDWSLKEAIDTSWRPVDAVRKSIEDGVECPLNLSLAFCHNAISNLDFAYRLLLCEPTAVDIPSGAADVVCGRRAEEGHELSDLFWGDKLRGRLLLG